MDYLGESGIITRVLVKQIRRLERGQSDLTMESETGAMLPAASTAARGEE